MPNTYKAIVQYAAYQADWKETYWIVADTPQQAVQKFDGNWQAAALGFRHPAAYIAAIRCSDTSQPRLAFMQTFEAPQRPAGTLNADVRNTCAMYLLRSATTELSRHIWVRGLLDDDVKRDLVTGADILEPHLDNGMTAFLIQMERIGLLIRALNPITGADPYKFYDIASITVDGAGGTTITAEAGAALSQSQRVGISLLDPKDWPGLRGSFSAKQVSLPSFKIGYKAHKAADTYLVSRGHYRVLEYRTQGIAAATSTFVRFGSRKTKSGPFAGRGSNRAVRLRSL